MSGPTLFSLREFEIAVAAFLVKYVVAAMVDENLVDYDVAVYVDDLVAVVTAAVVVAVCSRWRCLWWWLYSFCVAVDVVENLLACSFSYENNTPSILHS